MGELQMKGQLVSSAMFLISFLWVYVEVCMWYCSKCFCV